jgi:hypothetical protein
MALPFLIDCDVPQPRLYELSDGRFQLIDAMPIGPLLCGYQYLIVERALGNFLAGLALERVRFEDAVLFDRGTGEESRTHVRIRVSQFFKADQLSDLALDGMRLLTMDDRDYFVSPDLRNVLSASSFKYLRFTEGLQGFAGDAVQPFAAADGYAAR